MNQIVTTGIVLTRTNYQEADRILTILTPDHGKVRALARGVRKSKAKLAGGVELLSISEIGFIRGRGELATLTTARLQDHFGNIVKDVQRLQLAYELLKRLNNVTEDNAGPEYFGLLAQALQLLNNTDFDLGLVQLWFDTQLLDITGHSPNLKKDAAGKELMDAASYSFNFDAMTFDPHPDGNFNSRHIKLLRLMHVSEPEKLSQINGTEAYIQSCLRLINAVRKQTLHI